TEQFSLRETGGAAGEVPEAGGAGAQRSLVAALRHTRGDARPGEAPPDRGEQKLAERDRLRAWAEKEGLVLPADFLPISFDAGGGEHDVWFQDGRAWKVTLEDRWGININGKRATPSEYLERLLLQNQVFGDDIRLEGVVIDGSDVRIVTSQPFLVGDYPLEE